MTSLLKNIAKVLLVAVIVTNVFGSVLVVMPIAPVPQAQAQFGAGIFSPILGGGAGAAASLLSVPTNEMFSWHTFLNDVFTQIMFGIAYVFAQYFMQRFVSKLTEKYKIRNFLYYDQVLTNYYLSNFIRDKISDPDLRQIFVLLEAGYITGQPTGTTPGTGPSPNRALIPRLKRAIADLYTEQTGVDPNVLANPPANMPNQDYFRYAQYFYFNNPGYTERNLRAQFGEFQSAATTASQLEVVVGNGLKAGRFVGGLCSINGRFPETAGGNTAINTPAGCAANGGVWEESALDQARSFIDNPTSYVDKWMDGLIKELTGKNFDPNNFWFVIGNAFGRFLVNRLLIDRPDGTLNEDPRGYDPSEANLGQGTNAGANPIDIDGDGIGDGYDNDGDGQIDYCVFGGTAPNCTPSSQAFPGPGPGGGGGGTGACGVSYVNVGTSASMLDQVESAMDSVLNDPVWQDLPGTEGNLEDFRQAIIDALDGMGITAAVGYNGNCNSHPQHLAVQTSPGTGELYAVTRDGAPCPGASGSSVYDYAVPCRPRGDGIYSGPWSVMSTGNPQ